MFYDLVSEEFRESFPVRSSPAFNGSINLQQMLV